MMRDTRWDASEMRDRSRGRGLRKSQTSFDSSSYLTRTRWSARPGGGSLRSARRPRCGVSLVASSEVCNRGLEPPASPPNRFKAGEANSGCRLACARSPEGLAGGFRGLGERYKMV